MIGDRGGRYERIYEQLRELLDGGSPGLCAAMATMCAVLHAKLPHHLWRRRVGPQLVRRPQEDTVVWCTPCLHRLLEGHAVLDGYLLLQ